MGCADVCIDMDADGHSEFFVDRIVKARKPHKCEECREVIPVGAQYERAIGKWDGDFFSFSTCLLCKEIRAAFVCGTFLFGELWEEISQGIFPLWQTHGPYDCLAKLTTDEARKKMNARYAEWRADWALDEPEIDPPQEEQGSSEGGP